MKVKDTAPFKSFHVLGIKPYLFCLQKFLPKIISPTHFSKRGVIDDEEIENQGMSSKLYTRSMSITNASFFLIF